MSSQLNDDFLVNSPEQKDVVNPANSSTKCCAVSLPNYSVSFDRLTWHEHVYKRLPSKPTPHYIENILGLQKTSADQFQDNKEQNMSSQVAAQNSYPSQTVTITPDVNEPLNLSVKNHSKGRTKNPRGMFYY